ncbi:dTDP-4-dehydrorhamnose 3,5-epimerase [Paludibacterium purpuratum]|uniref:dTDP-4-dehydrorhamnose 3,5-epimerase n=1 Tax=Paludibacterium purpuratum TaxID=1144873 RepID=A0A4R7B1D6_9NEIS|nr:dTDP-4-dehydrorhamnose 3,5-epimerase [Paludibacterium purpuratum]TDR76738.1 dTDP-4-dehydrorhamnose 3,5-epimerase [Paludibacterium purpuratum]
MKIVETSLDDVKLILPTVFEDSRGFFYESFNKKTFGSMIKEDVTFVQDNHSKSRQGVLRGLHFQSPPHEQGKLVRVLAGEIYDVVVDIRANSPAFGRWHAELLSASNRKQLWIPTGYAHGFLTLSDTAEVSYKTTDYWHKASEVTIRWNDPTLAIPWPALQVPIITSTKDAVGIEFASLTAR